MIVRNFEGIEKFYDYPVILNLTPVSFIHTDNKVKDILDEEYEAYEVVYDWDEFGNGDGHDVVCFYDTGPGCLCSHPMMKRAYSKEFSEGE